MNNTNYDLVKAIAVRAAADWHEKDYAAEATCDGCRSVFQKLRELDQRAMQALEQELAQHVKAGAFPS